MPRTDRPADEHDASRREFFRTFSRQTVHNAGAVIGAATQLRRTGTQAARELFGPSTADVREEPSETVAPAPDAPDWSYRSAYRFTGDSIVLLDQRLLPGRVETLSVHEPSEVASAIRAGVVNGGPVVGQVAAYAMVIAARAAADRPEAGRQQQVRAAAGALRGARRDLRTLVAAVDAMEARFDALLEETGEAVDLADALEREADRIASDATLAHAAIGRRAAAVLIATATTETVELLMHGDQGPLSCGMVGIATTLLTALSDAGLGVQVWVTDAAPSREGSRVAAFQLAQHDVPHDVIPDSAVAWLLGSRRIGAAILRGDRVAVNGDVATIVGGLGVAQLAAAAAVDTLALAPTTTIDEAASYVSQFDRVERDRGGSAPIMDVVPAALITRIITEEATD